MKIIVTGGAGFIGSNLVDALVNANHQVLILDDLSTGLKTNLNSQAKFIQLDIADDKVSDIFLDFKADIVYHLAAQKNVRTSLLNPKKDAETNILGSLNILSAAIQSEVKNFVFISTGGAIYGDTEIIPTPEDHLEQPLSPYGLAKLTFEKYLKLLSGDKMNWQILRLANVYGPRQDPQGEAGVIAIFLDNIVKNLPLKINGDGLQTRDYVYVKDVVSAAMSVLDKKTNGLYNIATAKEISLLDLVADLKILSAKEIIVEHQPAIIGEIQRSCLTSLKAKEDLSWTAKYDLKTGLKETWDWFINK